MAVGIPPTVLPDLDGPLVNPSSVYGLATLAGFSVIGIIVAFRFLRKSATTKDRIALAWLIFNSMTRGIFEAVWVYHSTGGRMTHTSNTFIANAYKDYSKADFRWLIDEPNLVAMELVMVFFTLPHTFYIIYQIIVDDPTRHFWILYICLLELFALWIDLVPEYLTGALNLNPSNFLFKWVYLVFLNGIYGVMATWLAWESFWAITSALRTAAAVNAAEKKK